MNMRYVAAKFVTHLLITEQKERCVKVYQDLHQYAADDPSFMLSIILWWRELGLWVQFWDEVDSRIALHFHDQKKAWESRSSIKRMCIVFFLFFFQHLRYCTLRIHSLRPEGRSWVLHSWVVWGRMFSKSDLICGVGRIGFFTLHRSGHFWQCTLSQSSLHS